MSDDYLLRHLRQRHAQLQAQCDAFLEMIEHRESGCENPHELNEIGLEVRVQAALKRGGIHNVRQLCECTRERIERTRGIGLPSVDRIEGALAEHGYSLKAAGEAEVISEFLADLDRWGAS